MAFLVDLAAFNLLSFGPGTLLGDQPLTAKAAAVGISTVFAWLGSRYWTFSDRRQDSRGRELVTFALVNAGGMVVSVGCLAISHYGLGLTSALADNISANVVGMVLGTIFRFYFYRRVVFTGEPTALLREAAASRLGAGRLVRDPLAESAHT
ncbi:GtrA family protein [Pengzhenrongella sicca]|uniref:GtrA family protein n=2 Tax=Pengzhenrongella sicca TaxID=2819238 RepID=A0A8A4ZHG7_9MICO|nr:GtrA family protein [Pengzhenrongella sicca]